MCTHNIPFVVIRIDYQGGFNEDTQAIIFNLEKDHPKFSKIYSQGIFFQGTQKRVRNSRGERVISVRALEGLLYKGISSVIFVEPAGKRDIVVTISVWCMCVRPCIRPVLSGP